MIADYFVKYIPDRDRAIELANLYYVNEAWLWVYRVDVPWL